MPNGIVPIPPPVNEPVRNYGPASPEKAPLKAKLKEMLAEEIEIPLIIGGKEVRTGNTAKAVIDADQEDRGADAVAAVVVAERIEQAGAGVGEGVVGLALARARRGGRAHRGWRTSDPVFAGR